MKRIGMKMRAVHKARFGCLIGVYITALLLGGMISAFAKEPEVEVIGKYYEFDKKSHYEFSSSSTESSKTISGIKTMGNFTVIGNFLEETYQNDIPLYSIKEGNLSLQYTYDPSTFQLDETEWHLVEHKSKEVDSFTLDNDIMKGALILQSSFDGITWLEDVIITDLFSKEGMVNETVYTTKNIQQQNGCYYRLIIVYSLERKVGEKKTLFFIPTDDIEKKRIAEVYEFYVVDDNIEDITPANELPKKELGEKINTGKDTGYSENNTIDLKDPHYGWDIGTFFINGYTREVIQDGTPSVFLKNVGDKVTLWFNLNQDLDALDGDENLSIAEDTNGYDKGFEIERTNFGRGTLIISYTDYQGVVHDPVIYTNYLAANTRTGADTRVQLFEEGDYEVSLDYEIKHNSRNVLSFSILPSYRNYKIRFSFSIRNGNTMVYPFDIKTGTELSENAITENGFRLDMAKSRYLKIDVKKSVLKEGADGSVVKDVRFNRPAKDGETYTENGIYTFTVKNLYTGGDPTTKTIFVGNENYIRTIAEDTSIIKVVKEPTMPTEEEVDLESDRNVDEPAREIVETSEVITNDRHLSSIIPFVLVGVLVAFGFVLKKRKAS